MPYLFQDLDGCAVDFVAGVLQHFDLPPDGWKTNAWGFMEAIGKTDAEVWSAIDTPKFWADLPKTSYCDELIKLVESTAKEIDYEVVILSAPSMDEGCPTGKLKWLRKHLPQYYHPKKRAFTALKEAFAPARDGEPMNLLIDDSPKNVDAFGYAGGWGILVPAKHNELHDVNTIEYVEGKLKHFVNYVKRFKEEKHARLRTEGALNSLLIG